MQNYGYPPALPTEHVRNIALDIILTLLTCGIWNLIVQAAQMRAINAIIGTQKYRFWSWFLLSLVTCGVYHIYHEYRKSEDLAQFRKGGSQHEPIATLLLTMFGMSIVADAIQQAEINRYFGSNAL